MRYNYLKFIGYWVLFVLFVAAFDLNFNYYQHLIGSMAISFISTERR